MKNTDIAMIILIAFLSVAGSYFVVGAIPGLKLDGSPVKVKTIDKYTTQLDEPDPAVFNRKAINPTVDVTIGGSSTTDENAVDQNQAGPGSGDVTSGQTNDGNVNSAPTEEL